MILFSPKVLFCMIFFVKNSFNVEFIVNDKIECAIKTLHMKKLWFYYDSTRTTCIINDNGYPGELFNLCAILGTSAIFCSDNKMTTSSMYYGSSSPSLKIHLTQSKSIDLLTKIITTDSSTSPTSVAEKGISLRLKVFGFWEVVTNDECTMFDLSSIILRKVEI